VTFADRLASQVEHANSLVCVGLDPDPTRFPQAFRSLGRREAIVEFNRAIIDATADLVCCFKPNLGFYIAQGVEGIQALIESKGLVPSNVPVILDCKVGDMANTAAAYAAGYFGEWGFDAVTVNPYQGEDSMAPFLAYPDRGVFVLCKTSNPGSGDLQNIPVDNSGDPVYLALASRATQWQRDYPAQVGLVVGATYPDDLGLIRARAPKLPILLPGIGAQEGDVERSVRNGITELGDGLIVSSSRSIMYAGNGPDFADRARIAASEIRERVNAVRAEKTGRTASA